jgi:hypothetical protein
MMDVVVLPLVLQLGVPLALIGWVAFGPRWNRLHWWLSIAVAWAWIAFTALAGLWLALPWYLFLVHAGLLAAAMLLTWRVEAARPRFPTSIRGKLAAGALAAMLVAELAVIGWALDGRRGPEAAVEVSFPLKGGTDLIVNGGRNGLLSAHVLTLRDEARFRPWRGQSHGVDIVRLGRFGLRARGLLPRDPAAYAGFGIPVLAPCNGTVVRTTDSVPDQPVPVRNRAAMAGNHVIVECNGVWIVLAHLQRGSVAVASGASVDAGQPVGRLGNSGNSGEPHLHIHAQRPGSPDHPLDGDPLPIRFEGRYPVRNMRW